jgi:2-amino-4-hydroxy-6-hydroxymethyldihydropteridine diphosphokinase
MDRVAYIAMGTNLPFAGAAGPELLAGALAAMTEAGLAVTARSSIWRSPAWPPGSNQPDFHNAVVAIDAGELEPEALLKALHLIEARFGRERRTRWAARTLDLDIVAMEGFAGAFGDVVLPHPAMHERGFVLAPLAEIAPDWRHPDSGEAVSHRLAAFGTLAGLTRVGAFPRS